MDQAMIFPYHDRGSLQKGKYPFFHVATSGKFRRSQME